MPRFASCAEGLRPPHSCYGWSRACVRTPRRSACCFNSLNAPNLGDSGDGSLNVAICTSRAIQLRGHFGLNRALAGCDKYRSDACGRRRPLSGRKIEQSPPKTVGGSSLRRDGHSGEWTPTAATDRLSQAQGNAVLKSAEQGWFRALEEFHFQSSSG